jgi:hypothetical protein
MFGIFGKKKEVFTLITLGDLIKSTTQELHGKIEKLDYNFDSLVFILVNEAGNKFVRKITRQGKKFSFYQEITGQTPKMFTFTKLFDLLSLFPILPETKKSLSKKYS